MSSNQHKTLKDLAEDLDEEGLSFVITEWEYDELKALHDSYIPKGPEDENKHWLNELVRLYPDASEFCRVIHDEMKLPDYLEEYYSKDTDEDGEDGPVK